MSILITDGSGFIGTRLADELLSASLNVVLFDKISSRKYPDRVFLGDVRDESALVQACDGVETIYHLAAEHRDNVMPLSLYEEVIVRGSQCVAAAAARVGVKRIVFTS